MFDISLSFVVLTSVHAVHQMDALLISIPDILDFGGVVFMEEGVFDGIPNTIGEPFRPRVLKAILAGACGMAPLCGEMYNCKSVYTYFCRHPFSLFSIAVHREGYDQSVPSTPPNRD